MARVFFYLWWLISSFILVYVYSWIMVSFLCICVYIWKSSVFFIQLWFWKFFLKRNVKFSMKRRYIISHVVELGLSVSWSIIILLKFSVCLFWCVVSQSQAYRSKWKSTANTAFLSISYSAACVFVSYYKYSVISIQLWQFYFPCNYIPCIYKMELYLTFVWV